MVFILEDLARIMSDRELSTGNVHRFVQTTNDMLMEYQAIQAVHTIPRAFMARIAAASEMREYDRDVKEVFCEAYANAGVRGNGNTQKKTILTRSYVSSSGGVITIEDSGEGFDFASQIKLIESGNEHVYQTRGEGMRRFHLSPLHIGYHKGGRMISIATP